MYFQIHFDYLFIFFFLNANDLLNSRITLNVLQFPVMNTNYYTKERLTKREENRETHSFLVLMLITLILHN